MNAVSMTFGQDYPSISSVGGDTTDFDTPDMTMLEKIASDATGNQSGNGCGCGQRGGGCGCGQKGGGCGCGQRGGGCGHISFDDNSLLRRETVERFNRVVDRTSMLLRQFGGYQQGGAKTSKSSRKRKQLSRKDATPDSPSTVSSSTEETSHSDSSRHDTSSARSPSTNESGTPSARSSVRSPSTNASPFISSVTPTTDVNSLVKPRCPESASRVRKRSTRKEKSSESSLSDISTATSTPSFVHEAQRVSKNRSRRKSHRGGYYTESEPLIQDEHKITTKRGVYFISDTNLFTGNRGS